MKQIFEDAVNNIPTLRIYKAPFIIIAMYGASIGNVSIAKIDSCTNQACCVLSNPINDISLTYTFYVITIAKNEFILSSRGGTQPNISQNIIKQLRIPFPPLAEQNQIAAYLDDKCAKIDHNIRLRESLISKLTDYKKSLIYEVVTGKKEIM